MGSFMIVQARGFGAAEIPILEVEWVYMYKKPSTQGQKGFSVS